MSHALSQAAGRQSVANQKALGTRERIRAIVTSTLLFKGTQCGSESLEALKDSTGSLHAHLHAQQVQLHNAQRRSNQVGSALISQGWMRSSRGV